MDESPTPLFVADVFAKVLLATFVAVALGWVLAILAFGHLAVRDIVGSVISAGKLGVSASYQCTEPHHYCEKQLLDQALHY